LTIILIANAKTGACCTAKDFREAIEEHENEKQGKTKAAVEKKKKATAGKKIAKEVEKGVAKALMDKKQLFPSSRCCSCKKEGEKSCFFPLTAPWRSNKKTQEAKRVGRRAHCDRARGRCVPINPPIDDEGNDRPPPPLKSMIGVDVEGFQPSPFQPAGEAGRPLPMPPTSCQLPPLRPCPSPGFAENLL
jgi:hypothetical protein